MKVKRKTAPTPKKALSGAMEDTKNMVEVPVQGGNIIGVEKERYGIDYNGENLEEEVAEEDDEDDEEEEEEEDRGKGEEEERPKLDEGFFEIEAIRRKRVRKGQLQYLIKWRGWPETSNTWEPLENLQSCSDVIDAFEESLRSGKSSRKRKRKYGGPHTQPKKKQQRSSAGYNIKGLGNEGENNGNVSNIRTAKKADENGHANDSKQTFDNKEDNEYDPKLSELRGTLTTNDVNGDKLAINFREGNNSEGNGLKDDVPKFDYVDPVQNHRCTGAKRRKSGSVKRFKKDLVVYEPACLQSSPFFLQPSPLNVSVGLGGETAQLGNENGTLSGTNSSYKPVGEDSLIITKIIKPIGFSASVMDNVQDVLVSFVAMRSDGKEVVVDNRFLKANNPLLLIDFYEQHLKYSM